MTDKTNKFTVLGAPFDVHSREFRKQLTDSTERIFFADGGMACCVGNVWTIECSSKEADAFVAGKCDAQVPD